MIKSVLLFQVRTKRKRASDAAGGSDVRGMNTALVEQPEWEAGTISVLLPFDTCGSTRPCFNLLEKHSLNPLALLLSTNNINPQMVLCEMLKELNTVCLTVI